MPAGEENCAQSCDLLDRSIVDGRAASEASKESGSKELCAHKLPLYGKEIAKEQNALRMETFFSKSLFQLKVKEVSSLIHHLHLEVLSL